MAKKAKDYKDIFYAERPPVEPKDTSDSESLYEQMHEEGDELAERVRITRLRYALKYGGLHRRRGYLVNEDNLPDRHKFITPERMEKGIPATPETDELTDKVDEED